MLSEKNQEVIKFLNRKASLESKKNEMQRQLDGLTVDVTHIQTRWNAGRQGFLQAWEAVCGNREIGDWLALQEGANLEVLLRDRAQFDSFYNRVTAELAQLAANRERMGKEHEEAKHSLEQKQNQANVARQKLEDDLDRVAKWVPRMIADGTAIALGATVGAAAGLGLLALTIEFLVDVGIIALTTVAAPWIIIPAIIISSGPAGFYGAKKAYQLTDEGIRWIQKDPELKRIFKELQDKADRAAMQYNTLDAEYRMAERDLAAHEAQLDQIKDQIKSLRNIVGNLSDVYGELKSIETSVEFWRERLDKINVELQSPEITALGRYRSLTAEDYQRLISVFHREVLVATNPEILQANLDDVIQRWQVFCISQGYVPGIFRGAERIDWLDEAIARDLGEILVSDLVPESISAEISQPVALMAESAIASPAITVPVEGSVAPVVAIPASESPASFYAIPAEIAVVSDEFTARREKYFHDQIVGFFEQLPGVHDAKRVTLGRQVADSLSYLYQDQLRTIQDQGDVQKLIRGATKRMNQYLKGKQEVTAENLVIAIRTEKVRGDYSKNGKLSDDRTVHGVLSQSGAVTPLGRHFFANEAIVNAEVSRAKHAPRDKCRFFYTDVARYGYVRLHHSTSTSEDVAADHYLTETGLKPYSPAAAVGDRAEISRLPIVIEGLAPMSDNGSTAAAPQAAADTTELTAAGTGLYPPLADVTDTRNPQVVSAADAVEMVREQVASVAP